MLVKGFRLDNEYCYLKLANIQLTDHLQTLDLTTELVLKGLINLGSSPNKRYNKQFRFHMALYHLIS